MMMRAPLPIWPPALWTSTPGSRPATTSVNCSTGAVGTIVSAWTVPTAAPSNRLGRQPVVAETESCRAATRELSVANWPAWPRAAVGSSVNHATSHVAHADVTLTVTAPSGGFPTGPKHTHPGATRLTKWDQGRQMPGGPPRAGAAGALVWLFAAEVRFEYPIHEANALALQFDGLLRRSVMPL